MEKKLLITHEKNYPLMGKYMMGKNYYPLIVKKYYRENLLSTYYKKNIMEKS